VKLIRHMVLLGLAGMAAGFAANALSPHPVLLREPVASAAEAGAGSCSKPGAAPPTAIERIEVEEAKALCAECSAAFVDARGAAAYAAGHIPDAVHLPPAGHPLEKAAIERLRSFPMVVVYDGEHSCALADDVAARLIKAGITQVRVLKGAWPAWIAADGPGTSGACIGCGDHPEEEL
jgi:rhodanese-related sulfurtransferase